MKAMKAMKAMKKKTVSKIGKGHGQGNGAPWQQGEDCGRPHSKGPDPEQEWQDCEQEGQPCQEEQPLDDGRQEGPCRLEDQGVLRSEEGHAPVPEGQGVLQLSAVMLELPCHK